MATEQSAPDSATPEQRLATYFGQGTDTPAAPTQAGGETAPAPTDGDDEQPQPEQAEGLLDGAEDDTEEFDVDGAVYRLPRELKEKVQEWKEGALRREDYTRKTQEVAALHKHVSLVAEAANVREQFDKSVAAEREARARLQSQLDEYKRVNWGDLDVDVAQKLFIQREQLREQAADLDATIRQKEGQFQQWSEGRKRELLQQGQAVLQQTIRGWGPEVAVECNRAASNVGYAPQELENVLDPRFVRLAYKAAQWDKLQSGKMEAVRAAKTAPPVVRPGSSNGPRAAAESKYKDARQALRKSGSIEDAARLLAMRG